MKNKDELLRVFSLNIRNLLNLSAIDFDKLQEIRLRIDRPLIIIYENEEFFISKAGMNKKEEEAFLVTAKEMKETMEYISNYSLYAFEDEIKQGFITIQGGHRIGIAGKIVMEQDKIKGMKHISFINVRLSHQVMGCAEHVLPYVFNKEENKLYHTLIISPPRCGKTTLLRDMIRQLSDGFDGNSGSSVGVVDERSEIGACYMGVPQNQIGIRTDVLDCCPKAQGMLMLIRSMSPQIIAVDEIGAREDVEAVEYAMNCGCKLIATVHGESIEEMKKKPILNRLVQEKIFERYIILSNKHRIGTVEAIFNERGSLLCSF